MKLKREQRNIFLAASMGALDMSVAFSYLLEIDVQVWYAGAVAGKFLLLVLLGTPGLHRVKRVLPYLLGILLLLLLSILVNESNPRSILLAFGLVFSICFSLLGVSVGNPSSYFRGIAYSGLFISVIYLLMSAFNLIDIVYDRYYFFNGSHPNLGAEIIATGVVIATLSLGRKMLLIALLLGFFSVMLLQGRAGLVTIALAAMIRVGIFVLTRRNKLITATALIAALLIALPFLYTQITDVMMLDNEYRGIGTGFVGREDRWQIALDLIREHPFFGNGFGFYDVSDDDIRPHNFFLYGTVELGVLSLTIFGAMAYILNKSLFINKEATFILSSMLVFTIFNDRFLNMNPYPFILFISLILLGGERVKLPFSIVSDSKKS